MKELEKTKRISIAAVMTILVVIIALLSYKRPKHLYTTQPTDALAQILNTDYLLSQKDINLTNQALIDLRSQFDFDKGHLENAINMYAPEILNDENSDVLTDLKEQGKTLVLYSNNPNEAIAPYMVLYQLGFDNIKILSVVNSYYQNKLITKDVTVENALADVNAFIQESIKKKEEAMKKAKDAAAKTKYVASKPIIAPKIVVPKKKKKMPVEGGC
ncbi:rhodanese-like domain-containing protein [Winogradskyella alexanderae]|uniref:Rhodanese-like domain-containing protein n=1 Tax=Winogradskyella alexanderae TaxID=2877123 RepID=A0ABS7XT11_9FLAO|nr:rhodanese-like domain-containing protein [Winogradskyella alexanderae]MCA0133158.1 rhodanese-like domain-containing protein [Winogradskyella alexanderae]